MRLELRFVLCSLTAAGRGFSVSSLHGGPRTVQAESDTIPTGSSFSLCLMLQVILNIMVGHSGQYKCEGVMSTVQFMCKSLWWNVLQPVVTVIQSHGFHTCARIMAWPFWWTCIAKAYTRGECAEFLPIRMHIIYWIYLLTWGAGAFLLVMVAVVIFGCLHEWIMCQFFTLGL